LIELALVLAIVGLLLGMLIVPLNTQVDQKRVNDTEKQMALITEAILGFAVANGRLPCPATPNTANTTAGAGLENKPGSDCTLAEGVVPWTALGVPETDAWGRRFSYRVTAEFANDATGGLQATFALADLGSITVTGPGGAVNIASNVVATVVSHGKNGAGAYQISGVRLPVGAGDEGENSDADNTFVSRIHDPVFDDLIAWVSPNVLKSKMVAASRLP
jgi:type II secretory pathway pseudopilin PulG